MWIEKVANREVKQVEVDYISKKNYALTLAISKFDTVEGKKALQKILYFTNLKARIFPFQWNKYGPYSEEIRYLMEDAIEEEMIALDKVPLMSKEGVQYNMSLTEKGSNYLQSMKNNSDIRKGVDFAYDLLNGKSPRQMELLASVHYIASYENGIYSKKVHEIITKLKPEANFSKEDVNEAFSELKKKNLI